MHPATTHATSGTRRGSLSQRRAAAWSRFARRRHAISGNKFRFPTPANGRVQQQTYADASTTGFADTWDGNGNLTAFTDAKGNLTTWTTDSRTNDGVKSIF